VADNTVLNSGAGGDTIATDDIGGVKHQRVKLSLGTDGSATDALGGAGAVASGVQRVTLASDDPGVTHLATIAGAVDGTEMQVDIVAGGVTGRAEDAAHSTGHEGVVILAVRRDTAAVGSDTDGDYSTVNVDSAGRVYVNSAGTAAHDAAIAGNPVRIGGRAVSADVTAVTAGDAVDLIATLTGKQVVYPFALPGTSWSYASPAAVTDTADDEAKAAGAAGVRHYITGVQVFNGHDTVGTEVVIKDGSTVLWRGWAEQTGGGCSAQFNPPLRGTAATAVNVANVTNSSSTYFNLQGFSASE
jgi:hypothetical protein